MWVHGRKGGRLAVPVPPLKTGNEMKDTWVKLREEADTKTRWQGVARDRSQTLTEFIEASVEAAIIGKIDQATLDQHLRAIRSDSNAAYESTTVEEARRHIDTILHRIAVLRGMEKKAS
jgi:hypothetical protein